jgi:uncharacterized phage-associated protein
LDGIEGEDVTNLEPQRFEFSEAKFKELVIYIANRCQYSPKSGDTKLNKILFYSDFIFYAKYGRPITGEEYTKHQYGPVSRRLLPVRNAMDGTDVHILKRQTMRGQQTRTIPRREADVSIFDSIEIEIIDHVIDALMAHDSESVSELSHTFRGWQMTPTGETIPYESVFLPDNQKHNVSKRELEVLQRLATADSK